MQKTWKILSAAAVVVLVVAGGVYYFKTTQKHSPQTDNSGVESKENLVTQTPATNQNPATSTVSVEGETPTIIDNASEEDLRGLLSSIRHTSAGLEYENSIYRFSLTFPKSWGDIKEKVSAGPAGSKIVAVIKLTAQNDGERFVEIHVAETKYKNDPTVAYGGFIKGNSGYVFWWVGGGEDCPPQLALTEGENCYNIQREEAETINTFKLF